MHGAAASDGQGALRVTIGISSCPAVGLSLLEGRTPAMKNCTFLWAD